MRTRFIMLVFLALLQPCFAQSPNEGTDTIRIKEWQMKARNALDSATAFQYIKQAEDLSKKLTSKEWLIGTTVVKANAFHLFNHQAEAIAAIKEAIELCETYNCPKQGKLLLNQGIYYSSIGDVKKIGRISPSGTPHF